MKQIWIGFALTAALASDCSSQGTVVFHNTVQFQTTDPTGGNRLVYDVGSALDPINGQTLVGTQYVAELYLGSGVSSLAPLTDSISRFRPTTVANGGKWSTSTIYGIGNSDITLPGFIIGDVATLQVRVWDLSKFSTYEEALGAGVTGASIPFTYKVPLVGPVQAYYMEGLRAFALVPEPCILALGLFGASAMLVFSRSNRNS